MNRVRALFDDGTRKSRDLHLEVPKYRSLDSLRSLGMTAGAAAPLLSIYDFKIFEVVAERSLRPHGADPATSVRSQFQIRVPSLEGSWAVVAIRHLAIRHLLNCARCAHTLVRITE